MRDYGSVCTSFWIDSKIQSLSNESKLLAVYLLTGPHTNMLGCFRLPVGYIAEDLRWDNKVVLSSLTELTKADFITYDNDLSWVLIHNFLKSNPIENPNQGKSIVKLVDKIPKASSVFKPLVNLLVDYQQYLEEPFRNRLQTLSKQFRNQEQEQDQDQKQDQESSFELCEEIENDKPFEAIITIPLIDKTSFSISKRQIDEWQSLYPAIDVLQEIKGIRDWNLANPKRRKTRSSVLKHINTWLSRTQEKGNSHRILKTHNSPLSEYNHAIASQWLLESITNDVVL